MTWEEQGKGAKTKFYGFMRFSICSLSFRSTFFLIAECHHQELAAPTFGRSRSTTGLVIIKTLALEFRTFWLAGRRLLQESLWCICKQKPLSHLSNGIHYVFLYQPLMHAWNARLCVLRWGRECCSFVFLDSSPLFNIILHSSPPLSHLSNIAAALIQVWLSNSN